MELLLFSQENYSKISILGSPAMQKLNLPVYPFRIVEKFGKSVIFDEIRRRWIILTPEEWVRQNFLKFFVRERHYPGSLMAIEKKVMINGLPQRFDLLIHSRQGKPLLIAEFKGPEVAINQEVFDQAVRYNSILLAPYYLISNGISHFVCKVDFEKMTTEYLNDIPYFEQL
jgi:hypothetical protein